MTHCWRNLKPLYHPSERINLRVIDPFTIKPLDVQTIINSAKATKGRIITVEDHYYEGECWAFSAEGYEGTLMHDLNFLFIVYSHT